MPGKQATKRANKQRANKQPRNRNNRAGIPLAQGRTFNTPRFTQRQKNVQTLEISGTDMFQLPSDDDPTFHMTFNLPANPLYWIGTRLAGISRVYQKYRPVFIRARYVPNCPATSSGSITMGFIESGITVNSDTAVTTLLNGGGKNINIYQSDSITFVPHMKDDLFTLGDMNNVTVNPFTFYMYTVKAEQVPPGIIYFDWKYEFRIGSGDQQIHITTHTNLTPEHILALQSHNHLYAASLKFGWGTVLGWLKTTGVQILKNIGVCVCKGVLGSLTDSLKGSKNDVMEHTVPIREATYLTIDPSDVYNAPPGHIRCKDSSGSDFYLPDSTRASIYMSGEPVQSPSPEPQPTPTPTPDLTFNLLKQETVEHVICSHNADKTVYESLVRVPAIVSGKTAYFRLQFNANKTLKMISSYEDLAPATSRDCAISVEFKYGDVVNKVDMKLQGYTTGALPNSVSEFLGNNIKCDGLLTFLKGKATSTADQWADWV